MSKVVSIRNLQVRIPLKGGQMLTPVRGIDLDIDAGRTTCLVGESGSGKSMASMALLGLLPRNAAATADSFNLVGRSFQSIDEKTLAPIRGKDIAMIFQEPMTSLNPVYSIGSQLEEVYLRHLGRDRRRARHRATQLLERVGIDNANARLSQYPHELSGGLRQRVMIAMALMCDPKLIVADEPTTALDVTTQLQVLELLKEIQQDYGLSLLFITHDLGVVSHIADDVIVMYAGQIVESGPLAAVLGRPAHPYTRALLDCVPIPYRRQRGSLLGSIPGVVPSLVGVPDHCSFSSRCAHAQPLCTRQVAPLQYVDPSHWSRCHFQFPENQMAQQDMT